MITIKSASDIRKMQESGWIVEETLQLLSEQVRPGVTTAELNRLAEAHIRSRGAEPSFLGYNGYPASVCISINEEVVHGIPGHRRIREGDMVSCDVGAVKDGFHGDAARTFLAGDVPEDWKRLNEVTRDCFFAALPFCRPGYRINDIARAVQELAEGNGFGVVRDLVGHGIGRSMHEDPEVPNYVSPHGLHRLEAGMAIAIEPMITLGTYKVWQLADGWTVTTQDGKPASHYENTVIITEGEPLLTTCSEGRT